MAGADGEIDRELPVTAPMLLSSERVGAGLPDTDQERTEDWPELMEEGVATKDEMTGAAVAAGRPGVPGDRDDPRVLD